HRLPVAQGAGLPGSAGRAVRRDRGPGTRAGGRGGCACARSRAGAGASLRWAGSVAGARRRGHRGRPAVARSAVLRRRPLRGGVLRRHLAPADLAHPTHPADHEPRVMIGANSQPPAHDRGDLGRAFPGSAAAGRDLGKAAGDTARPSRRAEGPTVVAIVGPTATGKTALSLQLAHRLGGEVVNADSMQLYRGMDIGTAKLTPAEREGVPHHALDLWDVTEPASVAEYQRVARAAIDDIRARGRTPLVVGGSGLYVRAA